eukprot:SAG22_NODE_6214_length_884_cov_6.200000_2_plen_158_part_00
MIAWGPPPPPLAPAPCVWSCLLTCRLTCRLTCPAERDAPPVATITAGGAERESQAAELDRLKVELAAAAAQLGQATAQNAELSSSLQAARGNGSEAEALRQMLQAKVAETAEAARRAEEADVRKDEAERMLGALRGSVRERERECVCVCAAAAGRPH